MASRIAVIEDHGLIAHTLAAALQARGPEIVQFDPTERGDRDLVDEVLSERAELALLDLDLGPRGDALPLIPPLHAVDVPVVMVTGVSDRMVATDARRTLTEPVLSRQWSQTYHG